MAPSAGPLRQVTAGLPLQRGIDEPVIGVLAGALDKLHGRRAGLDHRPAQGGESCLPVQQHRDGEETLLLTSVDGQDLMPCQLGKGLLKVVVQPVDGVLLPGGQAPQPPLTAQQFPQGLADGGVIRQQLRHDVVGPL